MEYLKSKQELQSEEEIQGVFNKFDIDKSGTIEINELYTMFQQHGIDINKDELRLLFSFVDKNYRGSLNLEDFIQFSNSEQVNAIFRGLMKRLRYEKLKLKGVDS